MKRLLLSILLAISFSTGAVADDYSLNGVFHLVSLEENLDANTFDITNAGALEGKSVTALAASGNPACVALTADAGAEDNDKWRYCVADGGNATLETFTSGSWVAVWTVSNSGAFSVTASILPDVSGGADIGSTLLEWGDVYIGSDNVIHFGDGQEINEGWESNSLHWGIHDVDGNEFLTLEDIGSETSANIFGSLDIHKIAGSAAATSYEGFGVHMNAAALDATSTIHGAIFDTTGSTSGEVIAVGVFPGVEVLIQHTGSFVTPDQGPGVATFAGRLVDPDGSPAFTEGVDTETLFVSDDDEIYIGSTGTFTQLELILTTPANRSIGQPPDDAGEYYFRDTGNTWVQFFPTDGTDGFTMDGIVSWDSTDLTSWKSDYDPFAGNSATGYWIKIRRTRGASLTTTPVPTTVKILDPVNFGWDENGAVIISTLDTGQGANELYAMNQDLESTDSPAFVTTDLTGITDGNIPKMGGAGFADSLLSDDGTSLNAGGAYITELQNTSDSASKGPGYFFPGDGTYIELQNNANLNMDTNDFSVEIGLTPSNVTDTGKRLISKTDGTTGFEIVINEDDLQVAILDNTNNVTLTNLATGIFTAGKRSHIEITFDRDGNIQAYHGGEPVGTPVACTATATIANASVLRIGTETGGTTNEFNGEMNKVRLRTLVSTADEAKENYSDSAVKFEHIGASQTALYASDFSAGVDGWTEAQITAAGNIDTIGSEDNWLRGTLNAVNDRHYMKKEASMVVGKRYRLDFTYYLPSTNSHVDGVRMHEDNSTQFFTDILTDMDVATNVSVERTATTDGMRFMAYDGSTAILEDPGGNDVIYIKNVVITQIGAVGQWEQPGIGHGQWIDISGNELHGAVSAPGVGPLAINLSTNHREKYVVLTLTGNSSFVLPRGYKITSITVFETASNALTGGIDIGYTAATGTDLVSGTAVGADAFVNLGLTTAAVLGATHLTADDILYFSDGDDDGNWNSASLEVRVEMERLTVN